MAKVEKKATTVIDVVNESGDFTTLSAFLKEADLMDTLKGKGPFTVFAPTDDAFRHLPRQTRDAIKKPASHDRLQRILKHHVVKGRKMANEVASASALTMLDGTTIEIQKKGSTVHIGEATIKKTDMEAENGVVHVINRVLMPE